MKKLIIFIIFFLIFVRITKAQSQPIWSSNSVGIEKNIFYNNEIVYLTATTTNITPNSSQLKVYIVSDNNNWENYTALTDIADNPKTITTDINGYIQPTPIWNPTLTPGKYDIVVDKNQNGRYDVNIDYIDDPSTAGFEVLPPPTLTITLGSDAPKDHTWNLYTNGTSDNLMLKINLTATGIEDIKINTIYIKADGSGDDRKGISYVRLISDVNNNGIFDPYDDILGLSRFEDDDWYIGFNLEDFVLKVNTTAYMSIFYIMSNDSLNGDTFSFQLQFIDATGVKSNTFAEVKGLPINSALKTIIREHVENITNITIPSNVTNASAPSRPQEQTTPPKPSEERGKIPQPLIEVDPRIVGLALLIPLVLIAIRFLKKKVRIRKPQYGKHPMKW
jgi:hypothetical protein